MHYLSRFVSQSNTKDLTSPNMDLGLWAEFDTVTSGFRAIGEEPGCNH